MTTPYIDPKVIFASDAPAQDKPPAFSNYTRGMDATRSNEGRPTIKQENFIQQRNDLKNLYIHENGAALPFNDDMTYEENAVVVKDGELVQKSGNEWKKVGDKGYTLDYFKNGASYPLNAEIMLDNGDVVKSTIPNNTANPNIDMTGWESTKDEDVITTVESIADLIAIQNPKDGQVVFARSYTSGDGDGDGIFEYNEINRAINDGGVVINGWTRQLNGLVVTPANFGASTDGDASQALQEAVLFCSANNAILDGQGKTYNANSIVLTDNTHIKRIKINSNKFDDTNSILTTDYGMLTPLKNITLDDVELDGKRELHINVAVAQDGGRCCFLVRRPIDGLTIRNSKLNNAVTDGLMIFPVDWVITPENWTHFVKNVTIENSDAFWNGRWGISSDSTKHMTLRNFKGKFNGLDVAGGGDYSTGKSARLLEGKKYGGGFDLEEYHGFAYSTDINLINCDMTENASQGVLFERTGEIATPTVITITGGLYDTGTSIDSKGRSISFSLYSDTGSASAYKATISQTDLRGGDLFANKCQTLDVSQLLNLRDIKIDQSGVYADKAYPYTFENPTNSNFRSGIRDNNDDFLGINNKQSTVWLHTENLIEATSQIKVRAGGVNIGGIKFQKAQGSGVSGVNIEFTNGDNSVLGISQYGSLIPTKTLDSSVGSQFKRFLKAWTGGLNILELPVFESNASASSGGLLIGDVYRTSTGQLMIVY